MKPIFRKQWLRKGSLSSNVLPGTEGIGHPLLPLIYCPHIFQVQNYSFLHLYQQLKQDLPTHLPELTAVRVVHPSLQSGMPHILVQIPHCPLIRIQSLQIPVYFPLSLVLSQDLSVRSATQSVLPPQIDWYGPSGSSTSYIVSTQSNPMTSTSSNSLYGVQRFFQEFRLPDFTLDSFSGRLL